VSPLAKKSSIELVGEFFEGRAQVDRDLTTVSRVDRRLGLIKNLGRHSLPLKWNLVPRFDLRTIRWGGELTVSRL
jgi:hypothetical protein